MFTFISEIVHLVEKLVDMNEQVDLVRTKVEIDGNPETNFQK